MKYGRIGFISLLLEQFHIHTSLSWEQTDLPGAGKGTPTHPAVGKVLVSLGLRRRNRRKYCCNRNGTGSWAVLVPLTRKMY